MCTARRASHARPPSAWPTSCAPTASSWTRLSSLSSSDEASSHPTSALWASCCNSSHKFWPHQPAHQRQAAPHSARVAPCLTFPSPFLSVLEPAHCLSCPITVPSPLHQPADRTFLLFYYLCTVLDIEVILKCLVIRGHDYCNTTVLF